jgi:hypothetical protein
MLVRYVSVNPILSAVFFVMVILFLLPLMGLITYIWVAYLLALLFLRGVFVLLIYFSGISKLYYFPVKGVIFLFIFHLCVLPFFPFILLIPMELNMRFLYEPEQILLVLFIILSLLMYIVFVRYMLGSGSTLRRL